MKIQKGPTKHQIKSEATRNALLKAAETIFARDGYERAQIDEIAKKSGRTRGAVYAQYKTKEQLFFAVQERRFEVAREGISALFSKIDPSDFHARWEAIQKYFSRSSDDLGSILDLELKLYGLRHPESMQEWQTRYKGLFSDKDFSKSLGLTQKAGRSKLESRINALAGIKSGLVLSSKFLPTELPVKEVRQILEEVFESLFHQDELPAANRGRGPKSAHTARR